MNSAAVVAHYKALADAVDLPIIVQDYPPITGFAMEPALLARIAKEIPSARTIKLEDPPTPFKTARILAAAGDVKVAILGGLGGVFLLEELMAGAAANSSVCPSGTALITACVPMLPLAPTRFSMTNGCPKRADSS